MHEALSLSRAAALAPSIMATSPHHSRSERYAPIPTIEILKALEGEGYLIHSATESKVRDTSRAGFQKHLLRMRKADVINTAGIAPEIILINSNDGSSSYRLLAGMFRFACANGLICGDDYASIRISHKGDIVNDVIEGTFEVLNTFDRIRDTVGEMRSIELTQPERLAYIDQAMEMRFDGQDKLKEAFNPKQFDTVRRYEDSKNDIWSTFNRVQENMIKGGIGASKTRTRRGVTLKSVSGIDQNVKLNQALFTLAEKMLEIKKAG
jgi:hypothetical protein